MAQRPRVIDIFQSLSFRKSVRNGALIALVLVVVLLLIVSRGKIGPLMLVPIVFVSLAGAVGGGFYRLLDLWRGDGHTQRALANVLGVFLYLAGLYMSLIFALSLTGHWD
jgi:uncharacterized membrane protein YdfJ with MMPL/SSD domain